MIQSNDRGICRAGVGSRRAPARLLTVLAVLLTAACASEPEDAVVAMKGWSMSLPEVQESYNRLKGSERGPGAWDRATPEEREAFVRTLADKELLLRDAERSYKDLEGKWARYYRVGREKKLNREYLRHMRETFDLPAETLAVQVPQVSRSAKIRITIIPDDNVAAADSAVAAGAGFEAVARGWGGISPDAISGDPGRPWEEGVVRIDTPVVTPLLYYHALVTDRETNVPTRPIRSRNGNFVLEVQEYTPVEDADSPEFRERAVDILKSLAYMDRYSFWEDSLKTAAGYAIHRESFPIVRERMAEFWDSIQVARESGQSVDFQAFEAPLQFFSPEERTQPVFDMWGKTHTVEDFVRSLDDVDLDLWPTVGPEEKVNYQIENRVQRKLLFDEAERSGYASSAEFEPMAKSIRDEALLDQYYSRLESNDSVRPTEEALRGEYDTDPAVYRSPEKIILSSLTYPPEKRKRAEEVLQIVRKGGPGNTWFDIAPSEPNTIEGSTYLSPTLPLDVNRPAPQPHWTMLLEVGRGLEAGATSDIVETPSGVNLVHLVERQPERVLSFEEAHDNVYKRRLELNKDAWLKSRLGELARSLKLNVYPERLNPPSNAEDAAEDEKTGSS